MCRIDLGRILGKASRKHHSAYSQRCKAPSMQASFSLIEDYEAAGGAKPVPVKELTDSFIVIGGMDSALGIALDFNI